MKKVNTYEEHEQLTIDLNDEISVVEATEESSKPVEKVKQKELEIGAAVIVKPETKRFCDGRGIPDYARKAYVKRLIPATKTVLIETEPNGKELGLLFISDVEVV